VWWCIVLLILCLCPTIIDYKPRIFLQLDHLESDCLHNQQICKWLRVLKNQCEVGFTSPHHFWIFWLVAWVRALPSRYSTGNPIFPHLKPFVSLPKSGIFWFQPEKLRNQQFQPIWIYYTFIRYRISSIYFWFFPIFPKLKYRHLNI